jgi:3D (Asp-Asp-Asp) domain-containing protein
MRNRHERAHDAGGDILSRARNRALCAGAFVALVSATSVGNHGSVFDGVPLPAPVPNLPLETTIHQASEMKDVQLASRAWMDMLSRPVPPNAMRFKATAYTLDGKTAAGTIARRGIVAADKDVLPLGTRIRVTGAGKHSGEYTVEDTGPAIQGRKIDIKMDSDAEAKEFGERTVNIEVLRYGNGMK